MSRKLLRSAGGLFTNLGTLGAQWFQMAKTRQKLELKKRVKLTATVWQILIMKRIQFPETEMMLICWKLLGNIREMTSANLFLAAYMKSLLYFLWTVIISHVYFIFQVRTSSNKMIENSGKLNVCNSFDKSSICNHRKRKLCKSAESRLKKFVKSQQVNLFLAGLSHLKPLCAGHCAAQVSRQWSEPKNAVVTTLTKFCMPTNTPPLKTY